MTIIDDNTVVVFTSDELKNALENSNNYTYIYFEVEKKATFDITAYNEIALN